MPDCPGLRENTEPIIELEFEDVTATDPIPMVEHTVDQDARQVLHFMVILEIGAAAPRKSSKDLRDTICSVTNRPCTLGCFDRY